MPIGYGAGVAGNPTAKKRKLSKVSTFRDMQSGAAAGPSMARPSGVGGFQPGGFGPPGVGGAKIRKTASAATKTGAGLPHTASGYTAPATPTIPERTYREASRLPQAAGLGAPAGGFGAAPSPVFGAGAIPEFAKGPGVETGVEGLAEAGMLVPTGDEAGAVGEAGLGAAEDVAEFDPFAGEYSPSAERVGGAGEARGLAGVAGEQAAGGFAAKEEGDTLDQEMQGLIDDHEASWGDTEEKLNAQLATAMRRVAEMNAAMGSSVAGGFAGATAATILGSLQVMADAFAAHQKEGRNLQLSWLEKRMNMDFQREGWAVETARMALSELLSDPEAEVPEGAWEAAYPDVTERAAAKDSYAQGGGLPGIEGAAPEGTTGEAGALKNEAGDLLVGSDGLGTAGEIQADPWAEDGESHQWYARSKGDGQYDHYRTDENGNEVAFEPGVDGGRFPGDVSLLARNPEISPISAEHKRRGAINLDMEEGIWQHPDSGYPTTMGAGEEFLDSLATSLGYEDHGSMFGQGVGDEWKVVSGGSDGQDENSVPNPADAQFGGYLGNAQSYRTDNMAIRALIELSQFVSLYRHQSEPQGEIPSHGEIYEHLRKAGSLPHGTSGLRNPFE